MTRPKSAWTPSPNYTPKDPGRMVSCVIIHATATSGKDSPLEWLCDPKSKVSAHYIIDTLGAIYHLVHEQNVAWHAGESSFNGTSGVNEFSVGIELVNANDGIMPYTDPQLASCAELTADICKDNHISFGAVVGHADIAPGRKTDPGPLFPWDHFRSLVGEKLTEGL